MSELIALRHRLPKPPPGAHRTFALLDALTRCVADQSAALTILHGEPGSGRSCALMLALREQQPRPVYIVLDPCSQDDILWRICDVLGALDPTNTIDRVNQDPLRAVIDAIEVSEYHNLDVIVDAPWQTASLHRLADAVSRYADRSRWIILMDTLPWRAHMYDVYHVPKPTTDELVTWLEEMCPLWNTTRCHEFLDAHPRAGFAQLELELERLQSPGVELDELARAWLLELMALSPESQSLLVHYPELRKMLRGFESAGAISYRVQGGWQLTPVMSHVMAEQGALPDLMPLRTALQMCTSSSSHEVDFALFELDLAAARDAQVLEALTTHFKAWSERGWYHRIWRLLSRPEVLHRGVQGFEMYRIRCALITHDATLLDELCEPLDKSLSTQTLWMSVLTERGECAQARRIFDAYAEQIAPPQRFLYDVTLMIDESRFDDALARCESPDAPSFDQAQRLFLDSLHLLCLTWLNRREDAIQRAETLRSELADCQQRYPLHRHAWVNLARSLHLCGQLDLARQSLMYVDAYDVHYDDIFLSFHSSASVVYLEALLDVQACEFARAEQVLEPLALQQLPKYVLGFHVHQLLVAICSARDDYDGVIMRYEHMMQHSREEGAWNVLEIYYVMALTQKYGIAAAHYTLKPGSHSLYAIRYDMERALRLGDIDHYEALLAHEDAEDATREHGRLSIFRELIYEPEQIDYTKSIQGLEAQRLEAAAHQDASHLIKLERRQAWCALLHDQHEDIPTYWKQVAHSARRGDNAVWSASAAFVMLFWEDELPTFEDLFARHQQMPQSLMARVCEAIVCGQRSQDYMERRAAEVLRARLPWTVEGATTTPPTLWIDWTTGTLRSMGDHVMLPRRGAQRELLLQLCAQPGQVHTKQDLLEQVWGIEAFHPLKHENRLRMAVFKLRKLLSQLPGYPHHGEALITTHETGYALASDVAVVN